MIIKERGRWFNEFINSTYPPKAVLVAIAIPIFTTQLEKSREATDAANIRSAYAEMMADVLTGDYKTAGYSVTTKQQTAGWGTSFDFPADLVTGQGTTDVPATGTVTLTYDNGPKCSCKLTK